MAGLTTIGDAQVRPPEEPRVALVTPVFPPSVGGAELNHELVARALAPRCKLEVFTADLNLTAARRPSPGPPPNPNPRYGLHYLPSHQFLGERMIRPTALFASLRRFRPDVVWTNQPSLSGDLAGIYSRLAGVPWVATYHGDLLVTRPYARPYQAVEFWLLRHAVTIIPQGESYARRLSAVGLSPERIHAVTPGPGIGAGTPPPSTPGDSPFEPGSAHRILFVGGLDRAREYKRPELLLEALSALRRRGLAVLAWIVGDGDRRPALERRARELEIADSVRFLGRIDDVELARIYGNAWALVLPSTSSEAFGLVTLEALHYGCPSIVPDSIEAGEVLGREGAALTYSDSDPQGLAGAIAEVWSSPTRRATLAKRCDELAGRYTWDTASQRIAGLVIEAASGRVGKVREVAGR